MLVSLIQMNALFNLLSSTECMSPPIIIFLKKLYAPPPPLPLLLPPSPQFYSKVLVIFNFS